MIVKYIRIQVCLSNRMHALQLICIWSNSSKYEEFDWEAASQVNISFKCPRFHPHPIHPGHHTFLTQFSFFVYIAMIFLIYLRYFVVAQKFSEILYFIVAKKNISMNMQSDKSQKLLVSFRQFSFSTFISEQQSNISSSTFGSPPLSRTEYGNNLTDNVLTKLLSLSQKSETR